MMTMDDFVKDATQNYFQTMEKEVWNLAPEAQACLYRACAIQCVKDTVMPFMRQRCEECGGDIDLFFSQYEPTEYAFQRVVEKGHVYEMGYPRCLCYVHDAGITLSAAHCECSRQSILYVLHQLFPQKEFKVETIGTVLGGADRCSFRVTVSHTQD